jgi:hypothetical protein
LQRKNRRELREEERKKKRREKDKKKKEYDMRIQEENRLMTSRTGSNIFHTEFGGPGNRSELSLNWLTSKCDAYRAKYGTKFMPIGGGLFFSCGRVYKKSDFYEWNDEFERTMRVNPTCPLYWISPVFAFNDELPSSERKYERWYGGLPIHHEFIKESEKANIKLTSLPDNKQPDYPFLYIDWYHDDSSSDSETSDWGGMMRQGGSDDNSSDEDVVCEDENRDGGSSEEEFSDSDGELVVKRVSKCKVKAVFDSSDEDDSDGDE